MLGIGRLYIGKWYATDGVSFFKVLSPYLLIKILKTSNKRNTCVPLRFIIIKDVIVYAKNIKKIIDRG